MIRRNDTNFRFGQTSALHDAGEECPCSWWVGATLQLDILHSLRWMLLTARWLQYWNVSATSRISTGVHITWSIAVIVIMTVCRAELGWAGNMTPWHGYDKSMTRVWWHIVSWSPDPDLATHTSSAPQVGGMLTTRGAMPRRPDHYWPKLSTIHGHQPQQTTRYVQILRWAVCR